MKMKLKENKGITLIALIITIIVLLILAVVTISAVNEGSIFAHANNAATRYNAAATKENALLTNLLSDMEKYSKENNQESQAGPITLAITNNNSSTAGLISTTYSEILTATLSDGLDASNLTWSANNANVSISGSGESVTVTGVTDGNSRITATYKNGEEEITKDIDVTVQNKWAQRGITNVVIGATYSADNGDGTTHDFKLLENGNWYNWDKDTSNDPVELEPSIIDMEQYIANGTATCGNNQITFTFENSYFITCTKNKLINEIKVDGVSWGTIDYLLQE